MGFYGDISNIRDTHFVFDRIFPNRKTMDEAAFLGTDNIFTGRFVLVKYDPGSNFFVGDMLLGFLNPEDNHIYIDKNFTLPYIYTTFTHVDYPIKENWNQYFLYNGKYYFHLPSEEYFIPNNQNYYTANVENNDRIVSQGQIVRVRDFDTGEPTGDYYTCIGNTSGELAEWENIIQQIDGNDYLTNFSIDKIQYQDKFDVRGYDATVWEKVYSEGYGRFVMIARLSGGIMPALELYPDPPTIVPNSPYIDSLSTDAMYRIHIPTMYGFQLKSAGEDDLSDQQSLYTKISYNNNTHNYEYNNVEEPVQIYYNKQGINKYYSYKDNSTPNAISMTPTGESGKIYYGRDGNQQTKDIMEISLQFPALGNLIAEGYDLLYGNTDHQPNEDGSIQRATDVNWYYGYEENLKNLGDSSLGGKTYDLNTVAGIINTLHKRLGQIIVKYDTRPDFSTLQSLSQDYIYYIQDENKYFRLGKGYVYSAPPIDTFDFKEATEVVSAESYLSDTYYVDTQGTISTTGYSEGTTYYKKYIKSAKYTEIENGLERYEPNKFFLYNNPNYIRDTNVQPTDPNRVYYTVDRVTTYEPNTSNYFTNEYMPNRYFYLDDKNNYIRDTSLTPTIDREYWYASSVSTYSNFEIILYQPGRFYYKDATGKYFLSNYATVSEARDALSDGGIMNFYWLEFAPEETISQYLDENGIIQVMSGRRLLEAHPISSSIMVNLPQDESIRSKLYYMEDNNYIYYTNLTEDPDDPTPSYAIPRYYYLLNNMDLQDKFYVRGKYYKFDANQSYILSYENWDSQATYFTIDQVSQVARKFYLPETYYYEESEDVFIRDDAEYMTTGRTYYDKLKLYVTSDYSGRCPYGYEWSDYALFIPASVTLSQRTSALQLFEMKNLFDDNNSRASINGFLLELEKQFSLNNSDTRDLDTLKGAFNTLKDYLYNIGRLVADRMLYVNSFGQITSANDIEYSKLQKLIQNTDAILAAAGVTQ